MVRNRYNHFQPTDKLKKQLNTVRKSSHSTWNLNYHFVWIPKYRKPVLGYPKLKYVLEQILRGQSESREWETLALEIKPDHIHMFLSVPPIWCPSEVINLLKGNSSRQIRLCFPYLKKMMWKSLWAKGYYVSTAGYISQEQVQRYIEEQRKNLKIRFEKKLDRQTKQGLEEVNKTVFDYIVTSIPPTPKESGYP